MAFSKIHISAAGEFTAEFDKDNSCLLIQNMQSISKEVGIFHPETGEIAFMNDPTLTIMQTNGLIEFCRVIQVKWWNNEKKKGTKDANV